MLQRRSLRVLRVASRRHLVISKSETDPKKFSEYSNRFSSLVDSISTHNQQIWDEACEYKKHKIDIVLQALDDMSYEEKNYLKFLIWRDSLEVSVNQAVYSDPNPELKIPIFGDQSNCFDDLQDQMTISAFLNSSGTSEVSSGTETSNQPVAEAKEEKEEESVYVQTRFTVNLSEVPAAKKLVAIKEVKAILGIGLKDAKDMVENLPAELKKDLNAEEVQVLKDKFEALGCGVSVV